MSLLNDRRFADYCKKIDRFQRNYRKIHFYKVIKFKNNLRICGNKIMRLSW